MESEGRDGALTSALRTVAEDEVSRGASPAVEARVRAEVRSIARARGGDGDMRHSPWPQRS